MNELASGCAWCSPSDGGTDGICDDCMLKYFGVDPASIHAEIEQEAAVLVQPVKDGEVARP